jgi:hypothetical protein
MSHHIVYLVMVLALGANKPTQMSTERSMADCEAAIASSGPNAVHDVAYYLLPEKYHRGYWYCQPVVARGR